MSKVKLKIECSWLYGKIELIDYAVKMSILLSELQIAVEQSIIGQCLTKICPMSDGILPTVGL